MKGTVNKVILIGRLGSDPEVRHTAGGSAVANVTLATKRTWKEKDGNQNEETHWHKIVAWSRLAEVLKEYGRKGSRVYVEGRLQTRDWDDQNGQKRYVTEVVAESIQLLDSKQDGAAQSTPETQGGTVNQGDVPF